MTDSHVCLARISDVHIASVAAARLQSEGIESRLHGEPMGPFPVSIGRLAETQLWVLANQRDAAAEVLEDLGIDCDPVPS